jgi:hypothetical protein
VIAWLSRVPEFGDDLLEQASGAEDENLAFHRVMHVFTYSFGKFASSLSVAQLRQLAALINACVEIDDVLENAVATCFLEHLHQVGALKVLRPYLSTKARKDCHA